VDEVAKYRERGGGRVVEREADGVAHAEAHAEMRRAEDPHVFAL
jgi:hypothetical protein